MQIIIDGNIPHGKYKIQYQIKVHAMQNHNICIKNVSEMPKHRQHIACNRTLW